VLADIANASKHFELDRSGPRQGLSAEDLHIGRGAAFSDGSYLFSPGIFWSGLMMNLSGSEVQIVQMNS
jgi:hypothetical protein